MGFFSILGPPKEKRSQLLFRDDGKFTFRKMNIVKTFLVEIKDKVIIKGWKHFYKLQFPFPGHGKIPADQITLGFVRDVVLDPYGIIPPQEKPALGVAAKDNKFISDVAESKCYELQAKPQRATLLERISMFIGSALMLVIIGIIVKAAT